MDRIRRRLPQTEFIVMADDADEQLMLRMVVAGARGFLLGATDPQRVPHAVAGVLAGEAAFPRRFVRVMADELARRGGGGQIVGPGGVALTGREREVMEALAGGASVRQIAGRLAVTEATVRRHAAAATSKLGADDRVEALRVFRAACNSANGAAG